MSMKNLIAKALSVDTDGELESYLPEPLANEVIAYIREINIMRKHLPSFKMNSRTVKKPKKLGALSAYYTPDGTTATLSTFTSKQVTWEAKKLMAFTMIDEEAVEDTQNITPDTINQILQDFAEAIAEAEEKAILDGDPTHTATAPTPASATNANWYVFDPRLIFTGIFPTAAGSGAATGVDASSASFDFDMVNEALYNLGKFARNRRNLIGLLPSVQAAKVRQNTKLQDASVTGLPLASFLTGLRQAGETPDGLIAIIHGVPFYEAPQASQQDTIVILDKRSPEIGDRRLIKMKNDEVIEADQRKYVVSERIALNYNYEDALVRIYNLDTSL